MNKSIMALALSATMFACNSGKQAGEEKEEALIEKSKIKIEGGIMTPEVLYSFGRLSDVQVSPDKSKLLYGVTYVGIEQNKTNRELFTMNVDGSDKKQISHTPKSESNAIWIDGGKKIAFLSSENGTAQIWEMNSDGTNRTPVSNIEGGIGGFSYSPDGKRIFYIKNIKFGERTADKYPDLPNASGRIVDDLMYKHWSEWVEEIPHTFVSNYDGQTMTEGVDILGGEPYECPMLPFVINVNVDNTGKEKEIKEYTS